MICFVEKAAEDKPEWDMQFQNTQLRIQVMDLKFKLEEKEKELTTASLTLSKEITKSSSFETKCLKLQREVEEMKSSHQNSFSGICASDIASLQKPDINDEVMSKMFRDLEEMHSKCDVLEKELNEARESIAVCTCKHQIKENLHANSGEDDHDKRRELLDLEIRKVESELQRKRNELNALEASEQSRRDELERKEKARHNWNLLRKYTDEQRELLKQNIEKTMEHHQITFLKDEAELTDDGKALLDQVVPFLVEHPEARIHVEGHTNCMSVAPSAAASLGRRSSVGPVSETGRIMHASLSAHKTQKSVRACIPEECRLLELSQQRADSVTQYLVSQGCKNEFISKGWGCQHPHFKNVRLVRIFPQ